MSNVNALNLGVRFSVEDRRALDAWRRAQENPPTRSEAIRQIMRAAVRKYLPAPDKAAGAQGGTTS